MFPKSVSFLLFVLLLGFALSGCLASNDDPEEGSGNEDLSETQTSPDAGLNETNEQADPDAGDPDGDGDSNGDGDDNQTDDAPDANETTYFDPGWPAANDASIRPGMSIAGGCTANFVFSSLDNRTLYIGTASHCVSGQDIGDSINIGGSHSGTLVYCSWMYTETEDKCPGEDSDFILNDNDFALVRIDDADRDDVHPALLHWGGPTRLGDVPSMGDKTLSYGNSKPNPLKPIEGYIVESGSSSSAMYAVAPGIPGDSGSPVIKGDGSAIGVLIGIGIAPLPGSNLVSNLKPALEYMTSKTGLEVTIKTWELDNAGLLP